MQPLLRLSEDVLSGDADISLPALPRLVFVVHGSLTLGERTLRDDEALSSVGTLQGKAGSGGGDDLALGTDGRGP